jgi:hypothetical protein
LHGVSSGGLVFSPGRERKNGAVWSIDFAEIAIRLKAK